MRRTRCFLMVGAVVLVFVCVGCSEWYGNYGPVKQQISISDQGDIDKYVTKGGYLVKNIAACGVCHAAVGSDAGSHIGSGKDMPLSGGMELRDSVGNVTAPNITPDSKSGIGKWSIAEVMRAIRASINRDGQTFSSDSHKGYRWMSDEDAKAIAVYLLHQKAVTSYHPVRTLGAMDRNRAGLLPINSDVEGYVPAANPTAVAGYGRYLVQNVAQCFICHGEGKVKSVGIDTFAGGEIPKRTQEDFEKYLRSGKKGAEWNIKACPLAYYNGMSSDDVKAIASYLSKL